MQDRSRQKGNIVAYILVAIFLTGMLIAAMSQGAKKSASSAQIDEMMLYMQVDIKTVQQAVAECAQVYPKAVDVDADGDIDAADNPNPPFPLYGDLSEAGTGEAIAAIKCPGAPAGQQVIFNANAGNNFKMLSDTARYTTTYFNDAAEGAYFRITRDPADSLWTETIARLNAKYSACSAAAVTAADGTCDNGCFYYWIVRQAGSALYGETAQPNCVP